MIDTEQLGQNFGIVRGALLALGAPSEVLDALKELRDCFEVGEPQQTADDDGFKPSGNPPITPPEQIADKPGRKPWSEEARAAASERMRARQAARKQHAGEAA